MSDTSDGITEVLSFSPLWPDLSLEGGLFLPFFASIWLSPDFRFPQCFSPCWPSLPGCWGFHSATKRRCSGWSQPFAVFQAVTSSSMVLLSNNMKSSHLGSSVEFGVSMFIWPALAFLRSISHKNSRRS